MKLFVTIAAETPEKAVEAIHGVKLDHDGIEVRVENFVSYDPAAFRAATDKPLILTKRGASQNARDAGRAIAAGIDLVDVEYGDDLAWIAPIRGRIILSHHDFDGVPEVATLLRDMRSHGCAQTKLAVTPRTLGENLDLLSHLAPGTTLIGMGERGLYSRILAPFLGSELQFVSPTAERSAAPGQIALDRALDIYGPDRAFVRASRVFAVAGNPAGHSLSPSIHNPLFRSKGVPAAYTIASVEAFEEASDPLMTGAISGLSITAPFKEDAFAFARSRGAAIGENALACGAVNTLVNVNGGLVADNTDVDGFTHILARLCGRDRKTVALLGAGGTARAALTALQRAGMRVVVYNRTEAKGRELAAAFGAAHEPLDAVRDFDGEIVINTLTSGAAAPVRLEPGMTYVESGYGHGADGTAMAAGVEYIGGLDLLHAQAARQHELFMKVFDES